MIKPPHAGAALGVVEDVAEGVELMGAVGDGVGVAALGEEAALFGAQAALADGVAGVLLGAADPVARVVVGEAGEDVDVLGVARDDEDLEGGDTGTALNSFAQT